jgi:thiol-disulfide isomerase/thioredoxin
VSALPKQYQDKSKKSNTGVIVAVIVGVILVAALAVVAVIASGGDDTKDESTTVKNPAFAKVALSGEDLPLFDSTTTDTAVGSKIPTITGEDFYGNASKIAAADGAQVILVGAHWCPHCNAEIPKVIQWLSEPDAPKVPFTLVTTSAQENAPNFPPSDWVKGLGWKEGVLVDSQAGDAAASLGTSGFPYVIVVDKDGNVVARFSGEGTLDNVKAAVASVAPSS